MRAIMVLAWLLAALSVRGVTPELGKEKLRKLVRLPAIVFQAEWEFDPERGFVLGSGDREAQARISEIRKELTADAGDAERYENLGELYTSVSDLKNAESAWDTAAGLYRRRGGVEPENGVVLAGAWRAAGPHGGTRGGGENFVPPCAKLDTGLRSWGGRVVRDLRGLREKGADELGGFFVGFAARQVATLNSRRDHPAGRTRRESRDPAGRGSAGSPGRLAGADSAPNPE